MQLLPALVEADLPSFGEALSAVQGITGAWFAASQGGVFAPGPTARLVADMAAWGAAGVGQSSWGPTGFAIVPSAAAAQRLIAGARAAGVFDEALELQVVCIRNRGATVTEPPAR